MTEGTDFHFEMTQKHAEDISKLMEGQGRLESSVAGLRESVASGFTSINHSIQQLTKPKEPTSPWPVVSIVLTFVIALGAVFVYVGSGMQRESDLRFDNIMRIVEMNASKLSVDSVRNIENAKEYGSRARQLKELESETKRLNSVDVYYMSRIESLEQELKEAEKNIVRSQTNIINTDRRLELVDANGSRKWISSDSKLR